MDNIHALLHDWHNMDQTKTADKTVDKWRGHPRACVPAKGAWTLPASAVTLSLGLSGLISIREIKCFIFCP